jgi:hypothetical protein
MTDIVNEFFQKHYPADLDRSEDFRFSSMLGGMQEYIHRGKGKPSTIFPRMICADGFEMSVQGHWGAYSRPRDDFAEGYSAVEVGFPSAREELLMSYIDGGEDSDPLQSVYGYVPVEIVEQIIKAHGGLAVSLCPEETT